MIEQKIVSDNNLQVTFEEIKEEVQQRVKQQMSQFGGGFEMTDEQLDNIVQNMLQKEEEVRKTDIAKDEFLSMITHELKTPLVPIQGYVDILLGEHLGPLSEKQKERLKSSLKL